MKKKVFTTKFNPAFGFSAIYLEHSLEKQFLSTQYEKLLWNLSESIKTYCEVHEIPYKTVLGCQCLDVPKEFIEQLYDIHCGILKDRLKKEEFLGEL